MKTIAEGTVSHSTEHGAYCPVITPLADGSLMAAQHIGSDLGSPDNQIELLRTDSLGKPWRSQGCFNEQLRADKWAYRTPQICKGVGARLYLKANRFLFAGDSLFNPDGSVQKTEILWFESEDEGNSWSSPCIIRPDVDRNKISCHQTGRVMMLADDCWLFPIECMKTTGGAGNGSCMSAAVFSRDQGQTWDDFTVVASDPEEKMFYADQRNALLDDGRIYTMFWVLDLENETDRNNHWSVSDDRGKTWSKPVATNLRGQVCSPIPLADGRVAALYNDRTDPGQGIKLAISEDLSNFDTENQITVFDPALETTVGFPGQDTSLARNLVIGFGRPDGIRLQDDTLLTYFFGTTDGVSHTRWARIEVV